MFKLKDGFDYWGNIGNSPINTYWTLSDSGGGAIGTSASYSPIGTPIYGTGKFLYFVQNSVTATRSTAATSSGVLGCHIRFNGNDQAHPFLIFADAGTTQLRVVLNTSLYLEVYRNATLLGTSSAPITLDRWYFFEIKFTINDSTGSVVMKLDESTVLTLSSVDTKNTSNSTYDTIQFLCAPGNYSGREMGIDNLYLLDTTGGSMNDFLGEIRIIAQSPNAAGTTTQWTPSSGTNYQAVDDMPHDADGTYVETAGSGNVDLYNFPSFNASGTIHCFSIITVAKKTDVGSLSMYHTLRRSGTNYDGSSTALTSSYVFNTEDYLEDPSTTSAWSSSGVDAAELGIKLA